MFYNINLCNSEIRMFMYPLVCHTKVYNGTVYTTIVLKETNRHYCVNICFNWLLVVTLNVSTFFLGHLLHMLSMSNEKSFVFFSILVFWRVCDRLCELWTLNTFDNISYLFNNVFMCFTILYPGLSFQLTIGCIGLWCLCNFIVGLSRSYWCIPIFLLIFITLLQLFSLLRTFCCSLSVMSCGNFVKLFLIMNSSILLL
jgi:hypothetical protein